MKLSLFTLLTTTLLSATISHACFTFHTVQWIYTPTDKTTVPPPRSIGVLHDVSINGTSDDLNCPLADVQGVQEDGNYVSYPLKCTQESQHLFVSLRFITGQSTGGADPMFLTYYPVDGGAEVTQTVVPSGNEVRVQGPPAMEGYTGGAGDFRWDS